MRPQIPPDLLAIVNAVGANQQVYVSLVSDESSKEAEPMFNDVVSSLHWNQLSKALKG